MEIKIGDKRLECDRVTPSEEGFLCRVGGEVKRVDEFESLSDTVIEVGIGPNIRTDACERVVPKGDDTYRCFDDDGLRSVVQEDNIVEFRPQGDGLNTGDQ